MKRFLLVLAKRTGGLLVSAAWKLAGLAIVVTVISQVRTAVLEPDSWQAQWSKSVISSVAKNPAVQETLSKLREPGENLLIGLVEDKALPVSKTEKSKETGAFTKSKSAGTNDTSTQVKPSVTIKSGVSKKTAASKQADVNLMAKEMFKLVNEARAKENVSGLQWDPFLAKVAETRARDMIERNYFRHYGKAEDKFAPMAEVEARKLNPDFNKSLAENICAGVKSVSEAHTGFMNSPGHRKNIMDARNKSVGIAFVHGVPKDPRIKVPEGVTVYTCVQIFSN